jgi:hypothetical protein
MRDGTAVVYPVFKAGMNIIARRDRGRL